MTTHHLYGGSNAEVWSKCNGSPFLAALCNNQSNSAMDRGSRIHKLAYDIWNDNAIEAQRDELDIAMAYIADVRALSPDSRLEIYLADSPLVGGTIDGVLVLNDGLYLWDLKTGHTPVYPENNKQLLAYLWFLSKTYSTMCPVKLGIWHEQVGAFTWWEPTQEEIKIAFTEFDAATSTPPKLIAGPHCAKCRAIGRCPEGGKLPGTVRSSAEIATEYERLPIYAATIKGLENEAEGLCRAGELPGYTMAPGRKKALAWVNNPPEQIGSVQLWEKKPLTPTQVAKALGSDGESYLTSAGLAVRPEPEQMIRRV